MEDDNKLNKRIAEIWAVLSEVTASQAKTDAQMAKTDAQMAETDKRLNKLMLGSERIQSFIKNESDACEQRFVDSLKSYDLQVAGVIFDEIYSNVSKTRRGKNIELDALLVNGDSVALMEVKKKLHVNDVLKVRDKLINRFRELFPEHRDKRLLVLVAGESVNSDATTAALDAGFVVLSFKARELQMQAQQARYY